MYEMIPLASGITVATTHVGVPVTPHKAIAVQFRVTAVGATPTVTWKVQGAPEPSSFSDVNSNWYDWLYITAGSDTPAQTGRVPTTVSNEILFLDNPLARLYQKLRLVTSSLTNVTYSAEAFRIL